MAGIENLKKFIRAERNRQGLTDRELAERSHMTNSTVSRALGDTVSPSLPTLEAIARGLGYDFYSFILAAAGLQDVRDAEMMRVFQQLTPDHQALLLEIARQFPEVRSTAPGTEVGAAVEGST